MRFRQVQFCSGFLSLLVCAAIALAQNATGSITGAVTDPNNEVVTNAVVTVTNKATGAVRKVTTRSDGNYSVENLFPGEYGVKVEAQGFVAQAQILTVQVGNNTTGNFSMTIGVTNQTIEVTGGAPLVNTTDSNIGGVVTRSQINDLPLNGRSFLSVAGLQPGVIITYNATSGVLNQNSFFNVAVGGAPAYMTTVSVDGARANDRITGGTSQNFSAETVQEFQISTIGFDLSTGTVSAGAVNVISRSGGNDFHGGGFFFFRDHNMAAFSGLKRPTEILSDGNRQSRLCNSLSSAECASAQDPFFVRKQYGGTIGGPIKKNKLFFFGNYERNDQVGAQNVTFSSPIIAGFNHIAKVPFKQHLAGARFDYTINDKHTAFLRGNIDKNDSIAGTGLESTWIDSGNFAYQTQFGLTSALKPSLVNDFRFSYSYFRNFLSPPTEERCMEIASDPTFCFGVGGPRITFFGGLSIGNDVNTPQDRHPRTYQFTDNVNWTIGAHRVRFGGDWEHIKDHGSWFRNGTGTFTVFDPTPGGTLSNSPLYASLPASLKPIYTGPRITFANLLQLPVSSSLTAGVGDISQPNAYKIDNLNHDDLIRFYIQDAWQIRPRFTLNYGIAWSFDNSDVYHDLDRPAYLAPLGIDLGKIPYDKNNFDPALGFAWTLGKGNKTVIRASASLHHTSPNRTYLKLSDRTSISPAGAGLLIVNSSGLQNTKVTTLCGSVPTNPTLGCLNFSTTTVADYRAQDYLNNLPSILSQLAANTSKKYNGTDLSIRNIELTKQAPTLLTDALFDKDFHTPYTIHINAGVQREIMRNLSVSADFVMRRAVAFGAYEGMEPDLNLWNRFSGYTLSAAGVNTPTRNPVIPACVGAQANDPKAQCSVGPMLYGMPGILSRYSSLQIKVDKRLSSGFQLTGAYALSRYTTFDGFNSYTDYLQNFGQSSAAPKHQFTFSGIWDMPKYKGERKLLRGILNGYQVSSIMQMQSGGSSSITLGVFDLEGDGTFTFRLPGTYIGSFGRGQDADDIRKLVEQYNATIPAAPTVTAANVGRSQRDFIGAIFPYIKLPDHFSSGDSFITQDIRVARTVPIGEKIKLQLVGEGFNIFNVANLTGFSGSLTTAAWTRATTANPNGSLPANNLFGQATGRVGSIFGSGGPRAFQLAARLSF